MNKEALHKLAAESLNEGLRLDDWDKIGCVNHDCDQCKAQQEPVAWMNPHGGMLTANYIENFASGLDKEIHNIPLYTTPQAQPAQQEPVAGQGKGLSERLKLCARNVAFVAAGRVDMSSAAMQEMFALIDHVCVGLDSPQAQPAREPTIYVDPDAIRILLDPDHSGVVTAQLTRHKPDPLRGPKVGLSITKGNT